MPSPFLDNPFRTDRVNGIADFDPALDVESLDACVSDDILEVIEHIRKQPDPDPGLKIPVLLGQAGTGKTHLFGRMSKAMQDKAFVVFIPQIEDVTQPLRHLRYHLVESLFRSKGAAPTFLSQLLARLCRESFDAYFDFLPSAIRNTHEALWSRLGEDWKAALEIVEPVQEAVAFQALGRSFAKRFPHLNTEVVFALTLGWSPLREEVRRWLRGESMVQVSPSDIGLTDESPDATSVFQAVATFLREVGMTMVLCVDQLDKIFVENQGPRKLSTDLMKLLQDVPNLLVVLSCLEGTWRVEVSDPTGVYKAFLRRTQTHSLSSLTPSQAIELVEKRLRAWNHNRRKGETTWPFREAAIIQFVERYQPKASGLITTLREKLDEWNSMGGEGWIEPPLIGRVIIDPKEDFHRQWCEELDAIGQENLSPEHEQQDRLYRAVKEALDLWRAGKKTVAGAQLIDIEENAIKSAKVKTLQTHLHVGNRSFRVVVAVTKETGGTSLGAYFNSLESFLGDPVLGAVLIRPSSTLTFGATAKARDKYKNLIEGQQLRSFSLLEKNDTFHRLECLRRFIGRAGSDLEIGGKLVSVEECRELVLQTGVLENLSLFDVIFSGWVATPARVAVGITPPKPPAGSEPAPSGQQARDPSPADTITFPKPSGGTRTEQGTAPTPAPSNVQAWASDLLSRICQKLTARGQPVKPHGFDIGPTFARFKVYPQSQTDFGKVQRHAENLKISLGLPTNPIIGAQAGFISLDVQLPQRSVVTLREVLDTPGKELGQAAFPLGKDVEGKTHWLDLADPSSCHMLVAGTTGSGKSELLRSIMAALARRSTPQEVQFLLIDPKLVTFNFTGDSPYFHKPIAHSAEEAIPLVEYCFEETRRRYKLLQSKQLQEVGQLKGHEALPRIFVIFDEFADLMLDKDSKKALETPLRSIGALARAAGIHLILATQRPEAQVVTPLLRANLPARISLRVTTSRESKLILDQDEAAHLLGKGDLFWRCGGGLVRLQCPLTRSKDLDLILRIN